MAAAPQYGTFIFMGKSGKSYSIDLYASDVVNASLNYDGGSGAASTSPTFWICPEDVVLRDFSVVTGLTDTTKMRLTVNGRPTSQMLRWVIHVSTIAQRPQLQIGFRAGSQLGAIQLA